MEQQFDSSLKLTHKCYWLRGGLVGLILFAIIAIADFTLTCGFGSHFSDPCGFFIIFASLPIMFIYNQLSSHTQDVLSGANFYVLDVILSLILYFAVGAFLGWIFQVIKSGIKRSN